MWFLTWNKCLVMFPQAPDTFCAMLEVIKGSLSDDGIRDGMKLS